MKPPTIATPRSIPRILVIVAVILCGLSMQACLDATILGYEPLTLSLDGESELHLSTYPSWFPRETSSVPFLYKELRSPESVYFQVFVRPAGKKAGPNPHIESIRIHSFSYQLPGQDPVEILSDFDGYFWMQGDASLNQGESAPVPCREGLFVDLSIELTVNGEDYRFDEQAQAMARQRTSPLLFHALE